MNSSELTAWVSLRPYKQTQVLMWLHLLRFALYSPPLRKEPPHSLGRPCESGEKKTSLSETQGSQFTPPAGKPPPPDTVKPHALLAAAPLLAPVEPITKSDHCLPSLTSNLPQVKNDLHRLLSFLCSRKWMNQVEKWNHLKMQWQVPNLHNAAVLCGLHTAVCLHHCTGCEQAGKEQKQSLGTQEHVPASLFSLFCSFKHERSACLSAARRLGSGGDAASRTEALYIFLCRGKNMHFALCVQKI